MKIVLVIPVITNPFFKRWIPNPPDCCGELLISEAGVLSLHSTKEIQQLVRKAGFSGTEVQANLKTLLLPMAIVFMWQYLRSHPLAGIVLNAEEEARNALEREVVKKWKDFENDEALTYRQRMVIASARK